MTDITSMQDMFFRRAKTILLNMTRENPREWWQFWIPRWTISDEPLRCDAGHLMHAINQWEDEFGRDAEQKE
jgi:hypothetical protein